MEYRVERLDDFGRGIIYVDEKITFVKDVLVDEVVSINEMQSFKKYNEVSNYDLIVQSPKRVLAKCSFYSDCGGCQLGCMSYLDQCKYKNLKVRNILKKFANIDDKLIDNIIQSNEYYYRNKLVLHINGAKLGFYKDSSNDLVEIDKCLLVSDQINEVISKIKQFIRYNLELSEVMIRLVDNKIMLAFIGNVNQITLIDYFREYVNSLYLNNECLFGVSQLERKLLGMRFLISPKSFFQINEEITNVIYQEVIDNIIEFKSSKVLDLYCGTGTIGILVSKYVESVLGVEVIRSAIDDANINKELNNIDNIEFKCGKVENYHLSNKYDMVIVDPPRKGLDKSVISNLIDNKYKNIIYISCDVVTLARDIKLLNNDYFVKSIKVYDMFPNTYHVECLVTLCRK